MRLLLISILLSNACWVPTLAQNDTNVENDDFEDDFEVLYPFREYADSWDIWNSYGNKPCHPGKQIAHLICLPWNYTKEDRPANKSAVSYFASLSAN